jgi:hypothetical protein
MMFKTLAYQPSEMPSGTVTFEVKARVNEGSPAPPNF